MRWLQDNPFLAGLATVTIIGAGILFFFLSQSMAAYQTASQAYSQAVKKLHALQNRSPFPDAENLEKTRAMADEYRAQLTALRTQLSKMEEPLNPEIAPQQFADHLREVVDQIVAKAATVGVALPENFFLGFDQYKGSLPTARAAPALARQLAVISGFVNRLIEFKVKSIDSLVREPLPEESAGSAALKKGIVERYPFNVTFTAEQAKFRVVFNSLLDISRFLIIRSVHVQNTSPTPPPIVPEAVNSASAAGRNMGTDAGVSATPNVNAAASPSNLNVILGRELVQVTLRIEEIDFSEPAKPEPAKPKK